MVPNSKAGKISPPAINCVETPIFSITFAPNPKNLIFMPFKSSTVFISLRNHPDASGGTTPQIIPLILCFA